MDTVLHDYRILLYRSGHNSLYFWQILNRCFPLDVRLPKSDLVALWERREKVDGPVPEDLAEGRPFRVATPAAEGWTRSRSAQDILMQFAFAAKALRRA